MRTGGSPMRLWGRGFRVSLYKTEVLDSFGSSDATKNALIRSGCPGRHRAPGRDVLYFPSLPLLILDRFVSHVHRLGFPLHNGFFTDATVRWWAFVDQMA